MKTLKQYVDQYVKITDMNPAETTIPPAWWVFTMRQKDENSTSKEPEEAVRIIEGLKEADPGLAAVIQAGIMRHAECNAKQLEMKGQGANLIEIIRAGAKVELIPTSEARAAALVLLED